MKIGILITARLKSSRLKKKVLKDLNGYTVIERIINRAKKVVSSENIILKCNLPTTPAILVPDDDSSFTYLVMPVQVRS